MLSTIFIKYCLYVSLKKKKIKGTLCRADFQRFYTIYHLSNFEMHSLLNKNELIHTSHKEVYFFNTSPAKITNI